MLPFLDAVPLADSLWEFPRLAVITSSTFWHDLTKISPRRQAICCTELSKLAHIAAQLHAARALAVSSNLQQIVLGENSRNTIAASLNGTTYASSTQAISLVALIACFAFDHACFHHVRTTAKHFAVMLGLPTNDRRVLF